MDIELLSESQNLSIESFFRQALNQVLLNFDINEIPEDSPKIGERVLNLSTLYYKVQDGGGYVKVMKNSEWESIWKMVRRDLNLEDTPEGAGQLMIFYTRWLCYFEFNNTQDDSLKTEIMEYRRRVSEAVKRAGSKRLWSKKRKSCSAVTICIVHSYQYELINPKKVKGIIKIGYIS